MPIFSVIQTHSSCRFLLAVDSLGLRRCGSWSQFIDPPQDFPKQVPGHGDFGQLERDVPAMADHLGTDLDQLLPQRGQGPVLDLFRQYRLLLLARFGPDSRVRYTSVLPTNTDIPVSKSASALTFP